MGRFNPIYSDEQRELIIAAVLEEGLTVRQAVEKAAAGGSDVPAFEMPVSTAQAIVRQTNLRGTVDGLNDRLATAADRLLTVVEAEIANTEKLRQEEEFDHVKARRVASTLVQVQKLVTAMELGAVQKSRDSHAQESAATHPGSSRVVDDLISEMRKYKREHGDAEKADRQSDEAPKHDPELVKLADEIRASWPTDLKQDGST